MCAGGSPPAPFSFERAPRRSNDPFAPALSTQSPSTAIRSVSAQRSQVVPQSMPIYIRHVLLEFVVRGFPHRKGTSKQLSPFVCENENAASPVRRILRNFDQPAAFQRLQRGSEGGPVHRQQSRNRPHRWRLGSIQRHQERVLPVCKSKGTQLFVEPARQCARCALRMKTQATIPYQERLIVRELLCT